MTMRKKIFSLALLQILVVQVICASQIKGTKGCDFIFFLPFLQNENNFFYNTWHISSFVTLYAGAGAAELFTPNPVAEKATCCNDGHLLSCVSVKVNADIIFTGQDQDISFNGVKLSFSNPIDPTAKFTRTSRVTRPSSHHWKLEDPRWPLLWAGDLRRRRRLHLQRVWLDPWSWWRRRRCLHERWCGYSHCSLW